MSITTAFTELLGCAVPIQAAGMGAASTPVLTVAVSNAGGLGMLAATGDDLAADIDAALAGAPGRPFGVNFLMPFFDRAVLDAVDVPVVAAGGIATARGLAAVLAAGVSAARIGTRFAATLESGAHPAHKQALVDAEATDTVISETYSVWWPDAPHRTLRSAMQAAQALDDEFVGDVGGVGEPFQIPRFAVRPPNRATRGHIEAMALYAGQSVGAVTAIVPAAELVRELADGAAKLLNTARPAPQPNTTGEPDHAPPADPSHRPDVATRAASEPAPGAEQAEET